MRETKRPKWGRIITTVVIFSLLLGGGFYAYNTLWGSYGDRILSFFNKETDDYEGSGHGEASITVYAGEVGSDIANSLEEAGVVKDANVFYKLLLTKPDVNFLPGSYKLSQKMSSEAALQALLDPANRIERGAAVREGLTAEQTFEVLAAGTDLPVKDFRKAAKKIKNFDLPKKVDSLEGWLFPANYEFAPEDTAKDMLMQMVDMQKAVLADFNVPTKKQLQILTVASIIEKEAGTAADFAKVATVIYNRLEVGMLLGMDSTAQFGVGEHDNGNVWSSEEALTSQNPWNTYVHEGLPIGPIANPGEAAIQAALNPEPGDWLYFVVAPGGTGSSVFTETLEEHEIAVEEYRLWCEETADSGC